MTPIDPARRDRSLAGVLLMIAAVTCFTGLDATAKWCGQFIPPLETVGLRYVSALVFISGLVRPWSNLSVLRTVSPRLQVLRAMTLVAATVCSFTALHYLPLGQVTAISFAAPLMVAVMAGPLLGEWPGRHRYAAIITGFCGVLVVTRPGGDMHWAVLVALATAVANAAYALITRMLAGRDRPRTTLFYSGLVGALVVIPVLPVVWAMPPGRVWAAVVGMGVLATLGHYLLIQANERAAASVLAPFSYTQLVGATLLGWVVFGDVPDRFTLLGGLVIGLSGITMLLQDRRLRRRAADAGARRSR